VTVEIPLSGKRVAAYIVRDDHPPLCVTLGAAGRAKYALAQMLAAGWRIVEATPAERALMKSHGIAIDETE
jgi:hypothetical protein